MITVAILINNHPIMARSAFNTQKQNAGLTIYKVDDGSIVLHDPNEGVVSLAIKLLQTIVEEREY